MIYKTLKIYGADGHRQRVAFGESVRHDWSGSAYARPVTVDLINADISGTYEYSIFRVYAPTLDMVRQEINGQISDGIFENCRIGRIEDATSEDIPALDAFDRIHGHIAAEPSAAAWYEE